jgi:hypothetical protein
LKKVKFDLPANDPTLTAKSNRYTFLYTKENKTTAENTELASLQIELEPYHIRAADWNELFTSVSDGKNAVATAITGKGVPASGSDTFTQLASKVGSINTGTDTSDATAVAGDILASKTAYAGGKITGTLALTGNATSAQVLSGRTYYDTDAKTKRTGIMPSRDGVTDVVNTTAGAGNIWARIPSGAYVTNAVGGVGYPEVKLNDPDFIPANIPSNKNIFGLQGTMPVLGSEVYPGWRQADVFMPPTVPGRIHLRIPLGAYLTGTSEQQGQMGVYADDPDFIAENIRSGINLFGLLGTAFVGKKVASGSATLPNGNYFAVSGIGFTPSLIVGVARQNPSAFSIYSSFFTNNGTPIRSFDGGSTMYYYSNGGSGYYVNASGFALYTAYGAPGYIYDWVAVE